SIDAVPANMVEIRPHVMASVPRLYEKIYARVLDSVRSSSPLRQRIFAWGGRVGERWAELAIEKRPVPAGLQAQKLLADRLVFAKLRKRTGGGGAFFFFWGGAPPPPPPA